MPSSYISRFCALAKARKNAVVVGLDPRWNDLPPDIRQKHGAVTKPGPEWAAAFEEFSLRIIDVVANMVPAVKPQAAFFEECGAAGMVALERVMKAARRAGLLVICDGKRGDIGSTAEAYARAYLAGEDPEAAPWGADALTVNPYLGRDTLQPFIDVAVQRGAGIYVLVRTSNPGAGVFQDRLTEGQPLYRHVAAVVQQIANETRGSEIFGVVGAVAGATYPRELAELREAMPNVHLLVPGYGSQGAKGPDVAAAFHADGQGAVVNSSRGIIFAYQKAPYAEAFGPARWEEAVAAATRDMIADLAANTPCGGL